MVTFDDLTRGNVKKKRTSATEKARCISINRKQPLAIPTDWGDMSETDDVPPSKSI
jgi:hypothetical protein